jgi:hypothetical protein
MTLCSFSQMKARSKKKPPYYLIGEGRDRRTWTTTLFALLLIWGSTTTSSTKIIMGKMSSLTSIFWHPPKRNSGFLPLSSAKDANLLRLLINALHSRSLLSRLIKSLNALKFHRYNHIRTWTTLIISEGLNSEGSQKMDATPGKSSLWLIGRSSMWERFMTKFRRHKSMTR